MTKEEIKQNVTMPEVVRRYGIEIRRDGMCSCPFHGRDRHPSMKVFKDGCHCFTCGAHEDIFSFIQRMDDCDFKTAFISLGGTYEHHDSKRARINARSKLNASKDKKRIEADIFRVGGRIYQEMIQTLDWLRFIKRYHPAFSRSWCIAVNALPELDYWYTQIFCTKDGKDEADGIHILEKCKKVREELFPER